MPKRRARGSGSIFFDDRRQLWVGRIPVGKLPSGRTRYAEVSHAKQGECLRRMALVAPPGPDVTFAAWSARWLAAHDGRPSTAHTYASAARTWLVPAWGHLRLAEITPSRVEELAAAIRAADRGASTITLVLAVARAILMGAVRDGVISRNPVSVARKPKKSKKKIDPFTLEEL